MKGIENMANKTSTKNSANKISEKNKSGANKSANNLVKIPKDLINQRKSKNVINVSYEYSEENNISFDIYNYIDPHKIPTFAEYCIITSMINGEYKDYLFETNFRVAVLMQFTNLDIASTPEYLYYLIEGEDSLFWFVWYRLDKDLREFIEAISNSRRQEELSKQKASLSPIYRLVSIFGDQLNDYSKKAVEMLKSDIALDDFVGEDSNETIGVT